MDSTSTSNVTDDQELAKVLENMNQQVTAAPEIPAEDTTQATPADTPVDGMAFEETPAAAAPVDPAVAPTSAVDPAAAPMPAVSASPELESIKKTALEELRPLVDKLDLPAD